MSDDLIRRKDVLDVFEQHWHLIDIMVAIKALPSAQPERKKGKWVLHPEVKNIYGGIYIECSECHTKYVVQHIEDEKYCRNCGANMKGEANDPEM